MLFLNWPEEEEDEEEEEEEGRVGEGPEASVRQETPVSVDSIPLEWDHTVDVGGSSSHEEDEGPYYSALSGNYDNRRTTHAALVAGRVCRLYM